MDAEIEWPLRRKYPDANVNALANKFPESLVAPEVSSEAKALIEVMTEFSNHKRLQELSTQENRTFKLIVEGYNTHQISKMLGVKIRRVNQLIRSIGLKIKKYYDVEIENH